MEKLGRFPVHSSSPSGTWKTGSVCDCKSHIVDDMILLRDWYLIKSPKVHMGKRLAVGGILSKGDVKNFQSAPIIQRLNAFRLRTADGLIILLVGLIDGQRTTENGFPSEIGFPFTWEILANVYIRSDDTSCSSLGHDNDVKELMHSVGRASRVRIFSDDVKWSKSDSADGPENDRSMQSSFARKIEDKSGSFLKGPALHVGSNPKNFSPSDAWKSEDKGTVHKYNISSSGCALGNVQKFDVDGKMAPDDGDRCVKNCLDEAIPNQTLLDTLNSISMGISYKNKGMQPDHECRNVNSDMEENAADKPSPVKGTGNSYYVASVSASQSVELTPNTVIYPGSHEVGYGANTGFDKDCNSLPKAPECSSDLLNANIPIENLRGGNGNVVKDPEIQNVSSSEIMYLSESGIVIPLVTPFKCLPARSASSPVVLTHKKVPCQPGKVTPIDAKNGAFVESSVGERIRDAAKLAIGGCTTRSNSKTFEGEHVESENDSLLQSPVKRTKASQLGLSKELSQRGAQMRSESIKVTRKDASPVAPSTQRVTRSRARSSSFEGVEEEEQICGSGLKDGYNKDATTPMDCPKDALLEMDGSTLAAEIQNVSSSEIMYLSESGIVIPLVTPFKCMPARSASSPVVLTHKIVPCQPGKVTPIDAKNGAFVESSVGERIRDAAKLAIGGCTTRSNSKTIEGEHVESENDSLLQSPVKRTKTSQLGLSKELSQRGAQMRSESIKVTRKDASSVAPSTQRVTRSRARSSSFEGLEEEEQIGGSGLKDGYNKDATTPMDSPKDALLEMDGSTSDASEFRIGENKDKMRLGAETNDSSHRITRLRATSSSLGSLQKERKRGCSTQQDVSGEDIAVSISCSQDTFLNMVSETSNSLESEPGKNKDKMGLGAKNFDSGKRITISTAMSSSLRCSRKEGEGDCHIQKDTSSVDVTASKSCFKGDVCDSKSGATEIGVRKIKNQGSLDAKTHDSDELLNLSNTISHRTAKHKLQYGHATDLRTQHAGRHLLSAVGRNQFEGLVRQGSEVSDGLKEFKHSGSETVAVGTKKKRKTHVQHACRPFVPSSSVKKSSALGKALNLKMSRSGRLIVPPLAHWRNEQIVYDTEGEITCIFDGSQVIKRPGTHSGNMITRSRKPQG